MGETKKVRYAGRFGVRYGRGIRERVLKVEEKQRKPHKCPNCGFKKVKRISTGIYKCRKCGAEFAGGAYTPSTMTGRIVVRMVKQRKFVPLMKELLLTTEGAEEQAEASETKEEEKEEAKQE